MIIDYDQGVPTFPTPEGPIMAATLPRLNSPVTPRRTYDGNAS